MIEGSRSAVRFFFVCLRVWGLGFGGDGVRVKASLQLCCDDRCGSYVRIMYCHAASSLSLKILIIMQCLFKVNL